MGRKIQSGIRTGMGTVSRAILQAAFDGMTTETYEETGTALLGYTNRSFPSTYAIADANVKEVVYYDNYSFNSDGNYNFQSANAFHTLGLSKGLVTGQLKRNVKTNTWQKMVMYYDYRGKLIQDWHFTNKNNLIRKDYQYRFNGELLKLRIEKKNSANVVLSTKIMNYQYDHLGRKVSFVHNGKPIVKYLYDAIGRLQTKKFSPSGTTQSSKQTGNWTDASSWLSGILPTLADNVTINTGQTLTIPSGEKAFAGTLNDRGILKNFGTLNLGKVTTADLYTQTLSYHIRGGLRGINLDANGDLTNTLFSFKLEYEGNNGFFDGNIKNQYWKSSIDGVQRAYQYNYDMASRLISGSYGSTKAGEDYALNSVTYDFNGNITTLSRNGYKSNNTFGLIDNLGYAYQTNSNKLLAVSDAVTGNLNTGDFRNGNTSGDDYDYWADGSLKKDLNKGISLIEYNYLKLHKKISFSDGRTINFQYDANGKKLKEIVSNGDTKDYVGNKIYKNNSLYQISHDEGRVVNDNYEYDIKDHLGNLRVTFKDSSGIAKITQAQDYEPFGLENWTSKYVNSSKTSNFKFNSKETQLETGLIDLGSRVFNPTIGRILSIDKVSPLYAGNSTYGYCLNNPIKYVDIEGNFVIDAETARKYPALAYMVNHVLPNLVNNPQVLGALVSVSKKPDKINFIKSQLTSGAGPNIKVTHLPNNDVWQGTETDESNGAHYAGNKFPSEQNNLYLNRIAVERLEKAAKVFLNSNGKTGGGDLGVEMFNIGHGITHEFAHFLLNAVSGKNEEDSRGQYYEAGDDFSGRAFQGNVFNPRADTQEKPGTKQFYNINRNSSLMRGLIMGDTGLMLFITTNNTNTNTGNTKKKKQKSSAAGVGGANDSN